MFPLSPRKGKEDKKMEKNNEQVKNIWKPLCLVMAVLLALSWVFFGFLYSNGNVSFDLKAEQPNITAGSGAIIGESVGNGVTVKTAKIPVSEFAAYGVSPLAEAAYTLTATVTPSNATNKALDWSVAFVNPSSAWANGKTVTDYVTVTPTADGALTASVACLQDFGEQIKVIATSRDNPAISAACTVDYVARITGLTVELYKGGYDGTLVSSSNGDTPLVIPFNDTELLDILLTPQLSAGTMEDTFTYTGKFVLSDHSSVILSAVDFSDYGEVLDTYELLNFFNGQGRVRGGYEIMNHFIPEGKEDNYGFVPTPQKLKQQVYSLLALMYEDPIGTFTFTATGEYSSIEKAVQMNFEEGTVSISVENVSLDETGIVY